MDIEKYIASLQEGYEMPAEGFFDPSVFIPSYIEALEKGLEEDLKGVDDGGTDEGGDDDNSTQTGGSGLGGLAQKVEEEINTGAADRAAEAVKNLFNGGEADDGSPTGDDEHDNEGGGTGDSTGGTGDGAGSLSVEEARRQASTLAKEGQTVRIEGDEVILYQVQFGDNMSKIVKQHYHPINAKDLHIRMRQVNEQRFNQLVEKTNSYGYPTMIGGPGLNFAPKYSGFYTPAKSGHSLPIIALPQGLAYATLDMFAD